VNQKIKQLADQAKDSIPQGTLSVEQWIEQYNNLFAKLIIDESALVADRDEKNPAGCGWITKTVGDRIREHFGVSDE